MIAVLHAVAAGPWPGDLAPDEEGFRDAVDILLAMSRRIDAETASSDDLRRYRQASAAAERIARKRPLHRLAVDADSLAFLLGEMASVYTPDTLREHLTTWLPRLGPGHAVARFLTEASGRGDGLVISIQPIAAGVPQAPLPLRVLRRRVVGRQPQPDVAEAAARLHAELTPPFADDGKRRRQAEALRRQIVEGLRIDQPVPIGMAAQHDVITEVLRELQHPSVPAGSVRIVQVDGSESARFPVGMPLRVASARTRTVRLGLMSMRHMNVDEYVNGYWFRNRLVSVSERSLAETEQFCYRDTLDRLPELTESGINVLEIVHTGFEPAVVGFYRAVAEYVQTRPLVVIPAYIRRTGYLAGVSWLEAQ